MYRRSIVLALASLAAIAAALTTERVPAAASGNKTAPGEHRRTVLVTSATRHAVLGSRISVRGRVKHHPSGSRVALQRKAGRQWVTVARSRVGNRARFVIRWRPKSVRRVVLRVAIGSSRKRIGRAVIYRRALASWYGPGLYGGALACGGRLKRGTLGVANKRLPCGSKVTVRFRGRSVRVPVVDRGPYVGGREFDLTSAVRDRLGFDGVGTVLVSR